MRDRVLGAIIAGGQARRFGADKAMALLDGQPLIAHAATQIAPVVAQTVVCGREWGGLPGLADVPGPGLGPLGGIAAALHHAAEHRFAAVVTIACDMPVVPGALLETLTSRRPSYCADAPILGCWPIEALPHLTSLLRHAGRDRDNGEKRRELSIRRWADMIGATAIPAPAPLANINTPADLA